MTHPAPTVADDAAAEVPAAPLYRPVPANAEYRMPSIDAGEHALVVANERARAYSATTLRRLLPDLDTNGATAAPPQQVDTTRLAGLFDLDTLDALVDHGIDRTRIGLSNLAYLGDGANVTLTPSDAIHGALVGRAVRDGGRVVLAGLERATPGLRRLAEHVGRVFRARVAIRAVAGSGAFSGETSTVLRSDHLVIPIAGYRHVSAELPGIEPYHGVLGPGMALHLPAGAALASHPANEFFVHLEVQIDAPSPRNLLPLVAEGAAHSSSPWPDDFTAFGEQLVARWLAYLPSLPATRFSAVLAPGGPSVRADGWIRPTHTGGWCRCSGDDEQHTIVAAGIALLVPPNLWPLLAEFAGPPVPVASVATDLPTSRLVELSVNAGLCELLPSADAWTTWDRDDGDAVRAL